MGFISGRVNSSDWLVKAMLVSFVLIMTTVTASAAEVCDSEGFTSAELANWSGNSGSGGFVVNSGNSEAGGLEVKYTQTVPSGGLVTTQDNTAKAAYSEDRKSIKFEHNPTRGDSFDSVTMSFSKPLSNLVLDIDNISKAKLKDGQQWADKVIVTAKDIDGKDILSTDMVVSSGGNIIVIDNGNAGKVFTASKPNITIFTDPDRSSTSLRFNKTIKSITIKYGTDTSSSYPSLTNSSNPTLSDISFKPTNFCVLPEYSLSKTNKVESVYSNSLTNYLITVKNDTEANLSGLKLKDPIVAGLVQQSLRCDTSVLNNACQSQSLPTIGQLQSVSGFSLPTLSANQTYALILTAKVTQSSGSVTNTASVTNAQNLTTSVSDSDRILGDFEDPISYTDATCPSGHTKYYLGASDSTQPNAQGATYSKTWTWPNGTKSQTFTFADSTQITIKFPIIIDAEGFDRASPFLESFAPTRQAITLVHNNLGSKVNHEIEVQVNKPTSKLGYIIYDIDSTDAQRYPNINYQEALDVTESKGRLYSSYPQVHRMVNQSRLVAAIGESCDANNSECPINATWGYTPKNTPLLLKHSNLSDVQGGNPHVTGYADFFFCVAPPKVIVNKIFEGRANPTDNFKIDIKNNQDDKVLKSFNTAETNTSKLVNLTTNATFTIAEFGIDNSKTDNYAAKYTCENKATDSSFKGVTGTGTSFELTGLQNADEVVCTITNTAAVYTISGTVFNDNGGIISPEERDISTKYTDKTQYFNGVFDKTIESGIPYTTGHTITLDKCVSDSDNGAAFTPQTVNIKSDGSYELTVLKSQIGANTALCLTQNEPASYAYAVDTTPNTKKVALSTSVLTYPNNNFGDVIKENAALVLTKRQHVRQCNAMPTPLSSISVNDNAEPTASFSSKEPSENIEPGVCIAYMITAFNRGHIALNDIIINDVLQDKADKHSLYLDTPPPVPATFINFEKSPKPNTNGTIITNPFVLGIGQSSDFYFNTEYKSK